MKHCLQLLILLVSCTAFAQAQPDRVQGSGTVVRKDIAVGGFTKLRNQSSANLYLVDAARTPLAVIEADDNIVPLIEFVSQGDVLVVKNKDGAPFNTRNNINVYVPVDRLSELHNNGSGNLKTEKTIESPTFVFRDNGSGNSTLSLNTNSLTLVQNGSGNMALSGRADAFTVTLRGSGNLDARSLAAENTQATLSGSGNMRLTASKTLGVQLTGSGNVTYSGGGTLTKRISGSGQVRQAAE